MGGGLGLFIERSIDGAGIVDSMILVVWLGDDGAVGATVEGWLRCESKMLR